MTIETGDQDRWRNMQAFSSAALGLLIETLEKQPA
jgi:hypothetical protein